MKEDFPLIQDRLASRENFRVMANLIGVSGIPNLIEEDPGRSAAVLASSSGLQFPGMSQCPGTQISVTLNRLEGKSRQRLHSVTILELFAQSFNELAAERK